MSAAAGAGDGLRASDIVGTWRLERWEATDDEGVTREPFGPAPLGYVVYTEEGRMVTTISRPDRAAASDTRADADPTSARDDAASTFMAYSGTFRTDGHDVIHAVEMCLLSAWIGTEQRRYVELSEDGTTLTLSTDPRSVDDGHLRHALRWRRVVG